MAPGTHDRLEFDESEAKYSFEQKLSSLWTGEDVNAPSELLFNGSEISFMLSADEPFPLSIYSGGFSRFSIHLAEGRHGKHLGPLLYGKRYKLKAIGNDSFENDVRISAQQGSLEVGPVLISQPLDLQVLEGQRRGKRRIQGGIQVHKSVSPHPMLAWMKSFNDSIIIPFRTKASLVDHFFTKLKANSMSKGYYLDDHTSLLPAMLAGKFEEVDTKLPKDKADLVKKTWNDVMRDDKSEDFTSPNINSAVRSICSSLHKQNRDVYESKVKSMVIDDIVPLLKQKIQADLKKQMEALEKQSKEEKSDLLQKLRGQYLTKKEDLHTLSLISCMSSQARQGLLNKVKDKGMQVFGMGAPEATLSIRYSTEVILLVINFKWRF